MKTTTSTKIKYVLYMLIIILLYAFASIMENRNISEDQTAQEDCRIEDYQPIND